MSHTPGEWALAWEDGKHGVIATARDGKLIALIANQREDEKNSERKANARLMAAAPELLEVCEMFLAWAETPVDERGILGLVNDIALLKPTMLKARTAIAKAKGPSEPNTRPCRVCKGEGARLWRYGWDGENYTDAEWVTCPFCRGKGKVQTTAHAGEKGETSNG